MIGSVRKWEMEWTGIAEITTLTLSREGRYTCLYIQQSDHLLSANSPVCPRVCNAGRSMSGRSERRSEVLSCELFGIMPELKMVTDVIIITIEKVQRIFIYFHLRRNNENI